MSRSDNRKLGVSAGLSSPVLKVKSHLPAIMPILCGLLFSVITAPAQVDVMPVTRLVPIDSVVSNNVRFVQSVEVSNDTILVIIEEKTYSFVPSGSDTSLFPYPRYVADYDSKVELALRGWEIVEVNADSVTFRVSYSKWSKKRGNQKGRYKILNNVQLDRNKIEGVYIQEFPKRPKAAILGWALLLAITTATFIVGPQ